MKSCKVSSVFTTRPSMFQGVRLLSTPLRSRERSWICGRCRLSTANRRESPQRGSLRQFRNPDLPRLGRRLLNTPCRFICPESVDRPGLLFVVAELVVMAHHQLRVQQAEVRKGMLHFLCRRVTKQLGQVLMAQLFGHIRKRTGTCGWPCTRRRRRL